MIYLSMKISHIGEKSKLWKLVVKCRTLMLIASLEQHISSNQNFSKQMLISLLYHLHSTSDIFIPADYVSEWDLVQLILSYRNNRCIHKKSYVLLHKIVAMHNFTIHYNNFAILKRIKLNFTLQVESDLFVLCGEKNVEIYEVRELLSCRSV